MPSNTLIIKLSCHTLVRRHTLLDKSAIKTVLRQHQRTFERPVHDGSFEIIEKQKSC